MKKILAFTVMAVLALMPGRMSAGSKSEKIDFRARAGYSIGGTAPLEMPASIRSLDAYRLTPSFSAGFDVSYYYPTNWGMLTGLHFGNRAMDAEVTVKGYGMVMEQGDNRIEGLFTGHVKQKVSYMAVTLPFLSVYRIGPVLLKAGPYASLLVSRKFSGIASDGYLRQGDPTGPRIDIGNTEGEWATYDFSGEMLRFHYGLSAGVDVLLTSGFGVSADLDWSFSGIFKDSFTTVDPPLYPIYGTIGVFYKF